MSRWAYARLKHYEGYDNIRVQSTEELEFDWLKQFFPEIEITDFSLVDHDVRGSTSFYGEYGIRFSKNFVLGYWGLIKLLGENGWEPFQFQVEVRNESRAAAEIMHLRKPSS